MADRSSPILSKGRWLLARLARRLWVRAALFALLGVATALAGLVAERYVPLQPPSEIGADAVGQILDILASSMLTVTTFSVGVALSAYAASTNNVTPRATRLLVEDPTTQNALSTFVGAFLFSLVGIVTLSTGAYGERGRGVLFIVTIGVIVLIVGTMLRWIDHLTRLGRVGETSERVEQAAMAAIKARVLEPSLGGRALLDPAQDVPPAARAVGSGSIGYVQHIDMQRLGEWADAHGADVYVSALPGTFLHPGRALAHVAGGSGNADEGIRDAFSIGDERSYDQDPRFGLAVMAEIASRALSPAVNDSGTAIDVIGRLVRVLAGWAEGPRDVEVRFGRVFVPPLQAADLFDDAFMPIGRDGAGHIEVQLRLHKGLLSLMQLGDGDFRAAAMDQVRLALKRADRALPLDEEKEQLRRVLRPYGLAL